MIIAIFFVLWVAFWVVRWELSPQVFMPMVQYKNTWPALLCLVGRQNLLDTSSQSRKYYQLLLPIPAYSGNIGQAWVARLTHHNHWHLLVALIADTCNEF